VLRVVENSYISSPKPYASGTALSVTNCLISITTSRGHSCRQIYDSLTISLRSTGYQLRRNCFVTFCVKRSAKGSFPSSVNS
jgi:hypothetical protein